MNKQNKTIISVYLQEKKVGYVQNVLTKKNKYILTPKYHDAKLYGSLQALLYDKALCYEICNCGYTFEEEQYHENY